MNIRTCFWRVDVCRETRVLNALSEGGDVVGQRQLMTKRVWDRSEQKTKSILLVLEKH
jgi:hypothetical protein